MTSKKTVERLKVKNDYFDSSIGSSNIMFAALKDQNITELERKRFSYIQID